MALIRASRTAVVAAAALALTGLAAVGPVQADTGKLAYQCKLPALGNKTFQIDQGVNITTAYLGKSVTPVLTTKAGIDADMVKTMAGALKAKYIDGSFVSTVKSGGVESQVKQTVPRTAVPNPATTAMTLVGRGNLAALAPKAPGSVTYLPGNVSITLRFHTSANDPKPTVFSNMACTMPKNDKAIDKVTYAKSPTKLAASAAYVKRSKKVTASVKATASSGAVPAGKVAAVLYKGTKKLKSATMTLSGGKASTTFAGVKAKGTYKVVFSYSGTAVLNGSSGAKTFTVR